jgi:hypothetical protein
VVVRVETVEPTETVESTVHKACVTLSPFIAHLSMIWYAKAQLNNREIGWERVCPQIFCVNDGVHASACEQCVCTVCTDTSVRT